MSHASTVDYKFSDWNGMPLHDTSCMLHIKLFLCSLATIQAGLFLAIEGRTKDQKRACEKNLLNDIRF